VALYLALFIILMVTFEEAKEANEISLSQSIKFASAQAAASKIEKSRAESQNQEASAGNESEEVLIGM
jgi:hypothetical protein